jgi:hypothetical protein
MSTDLATTKLDALLGSYDGELPESAGTGLGTFYWLHGTNKGGSKTPGVFYTKDTEVAEPPSAPWQPDSRYEDQDEPERGYSAALLKIAPIIWHSQWYLPANEEEDGRRRGPKRWITGYQEGAQKHLDLICLVEGVPDPMLFVADGQNKCGAMLDILARYRAGLLRQATFRAKRGGKKIVPPWTFWLPISSKKTTDGKIDYQKVLVNGVDKGSVVTPPALFLPPDAIESLLISPEQFQLAAEVYTAYLAWSREMRQPPNVTNATYTVSGPPQLPLGRNVPVPIDESDEF